MRTSLEYELIWLLWRQRFQNNSVLPFTLPHLAGVFKFMSFRKRFQKVPFSVTKNTVLVWTKDQSGEKSCIFILIQVSADLTGLIDQSIDRSINQPIN